MYVTLYVSVLIGPNHCICTVVTCIVMSIRNKILFFLAAKYKFCKIHVENSFIKFASTGFTQDRQSYALHVLYLGRIVN